MIVKKYLVLFKMTKNKDNDFIKGGFPLIIPITKHEEVSELKERHFSNKNIVDVNTILNIKKGSPIVDFVIEGTGNNKTSVKRYKKKGKKEVKKNAERSNIQKPEHPEEDLNNLNLLEFIGDLNITPIKRQTKKKSKE